MIRQDQRPDGRFASVAGKDACGPVRWQRQLLALSNHNRSTPSEASAWQAEMPAVQSHPSSATFGSPCANPKSKSQNALAFTLLEYSSTDFLNASVTRTVRKVTHGSLRSLRHRLFVVRLVNRATNDSATTTRNAIERIPPFIDRQINGNKCVANSARTQGGNKYGKSL